MSGNQKKLSSYQLRTGLAYNGKTPKFIQDMKEQYTVIKENHRHLEKDDVKIPEDDAPTVVVLDQKNHLSIEEAQDLINNGQLNKNTLKELKRKLESQVSQESKKKSNVEDSSNEVNEEEAKKALSARPVFIKKSSIEKKPPKAIAKHQKKNLLSFDTDEL